MNEVIFFETLGFCYLGQIIGAFLAFYIVNLINRRKK